MPGMVGTADPSVGEDLVIRDVVRLGMAARR